MKIISAAILTIILCSCAEIEDYPDTPLETEARPDMRFKDTTLLDLYDGSILMWKLKTAYLERWSGSDRIFARPIYADIFDSTGEKVAYLRADSGSLDQAMSFINAYGNVHALSPKGASVRADSLTWSKKDNLIRTESDVRVVTEAGDVLAGTGFISDADLDNWQILGGITGIFQDASRRLKENDEQVRATEMIEPPAPTKPAKPMRPTPNKIHRPDKKFRKPAQINRTFENSDFLKDQP
jgi:LPS export ABC transporter protein LptC